MSQDVGPVLVYGPMYSLVQMYPKIIWPGSEALLSEADSFTWRYQNNNGTNVTIASCLLNPKRCNYTSGWTVDWNFREDFSSLSLHFAAPWEGGNYTWHVNSGGNITSHSLSLELVDALGTIKPTVHSFCPIYWVGYGDKCYYNLRYSMPYHLAKQSCENAGGWLTMPKTTDLFLLLANSPQSYWIGAQKVDGVWKWNDGSPFALPVPISSNGTFANMYKFGIQALHENDTDFAYCEKDAIWNEPPANHEAICDLPEYPEDDAAKISLAINLVISLQVLLFFLLIMTCYSHYRHTRRTRVFRAPIYRPIPQDKQPLVPEKLPAWQHDISLSAWQEP